MDKTKEAFYPLVHRLLHWGFAFGMLLILLTVLLRLGWMEKHHMAQILMDAPQLANAQLSESDAVKIAKSIRNVMFDWHLYAGYFLTVLLVLRFAHMKANGLYYKSPFDPTATAKEKIKAIAYLGLYGFVALSLISGLLMVYGPADWKHSIEEFHQLALWYLVPFLILHFAAIIIAEAGEEPGIITRMIGGRKP